ncbi:hypothetical protein [Thermotoga neapolitana]|uniref:Uncharacterized protein n=1 Tax=Thermotoga neapolitana (strain ATCC 49049 / DSM 4359 / NBRC 107923 / NS-E) TaxID=309803 RepID=B9K8J7_THENN|nr:hypothetical protein [Thermotoga neapolitana]ACM23280.1 Hypothetical Protein CTN_1104 [Thermotoga neapolitana DSM 4359]KFZ21621.1 hypothetical protein LA10_05774 [Thermotoga neapolitana LA10]HBF11348.1 hypothetical protein [Thermotoga neapolitana]
MITGRKACFLVCLVFLATLLLVSCAGGIFQGTTDTLSSDEANKLIEELLMANENTSSLDILDPDRKKSVPQALLRPWSGRQSEKRTSGEGILWLPR